MVSIDWKVEESHMLVILYPLMIYSLKYAMIQFVVAFKPSRWARS